MFLAALVCASSTAEIARAATYYVDGANPGASDSNAGTSSAPYRTISGALTARGAAGTTLLVRPAIYRETIAPAVSGASGNPLVVRATGPRTIVDGSEDYSGSGKWTLVSGFTYLAASVVWAPRQVISGGVRLTASTAAVDSLPARTFRWVSGAGLYVNAGAGNPGAFAIYVGRRDYGVAISGRSWITIEGFAVTRTDDRGIYVNASQNVELRRDTVTFANKIGAYVISSSAVTIDSCRFDDNLDHGVYLAPGTTNSTVRATEVARAIKPYGGPAQGIYVNGATGIRLERNRLHDNAGCGVWAYAGGNNLVSVQDVAWGNAECGFRVTGSTGARFTNAVAWGNGQSGFAIQGNSPGTSIQNSISAGNATRGSGSYEIAIESGAASGFASDWNVWWSSSSRPPFQYGSTSHSTIAAWRTASGQDAHSTQGNPRFVNAAAADFRPAAGSPAIDAGNAAAPNWLALDAAGVARHDDPATPNTGAGTPPFSDRGAFEQSPPSNYPPSARASATYRPRGVVTDPNVVFTPPSVARPSYLANVTDRTFGSTVRRITGDGGTTFPYAGGSGTWGTDARHHYSTDQPWSSDGTLISMDNVGGSPTELLLDGNSYLVVRGRCPTYDSGDDRWHPSPLHPTTRINVKNAELSWFDMAECVKTRSWELPFPVSGIGPGEGNPSRDGRYIALNDGARVFVVDMDPQPPFAPYPAQRIGPALDVSACGLADGCGIGWAAVSASGKYVVVKYLNDHPRVFDVDSLTLALRPRPMPVGVESCSGGDPLQGYIYDLGHPDLTLDPFDGDEDVIVGQEHCGRRGQVIGGRPRGGVVLVRLRDGVVRSLTDPTNEAFVHHVSARNLRRPGWVYVDYFPDRGTRFNDEIVAVKMDGGGAVQRFAHKHTDHTDCYRCESHAVPSPDGRRVLWASNWSIDCTVCGPKPDIRAYVVDASSFFSPAPGAKQHVLIDAGLSTDPDGSIVSYEYRWGDGGRMGPTTSRVKSHDYAPGTWTAEVVVTDNKGLRDSTTLSVVVAPPNLPPNGVITSPASDLTIVAGQKVGLAATVSDPDGGALGVLWDLGGAVAVNPTTEDPGLVTLMRPGTWTFALLVTDAHGLEDLTPDSVRVTVVPANGRSPVVSAPATASGTELTPIQVTVTAFDPDGDPIALTADLAALPAGDARTFTTNANGTEGTLSWIPGATSGRSDPYVVTFHATANGLSSTGSTSITAADVVGPNLVTNPGFETSVSGWGSSGGASLTRVTGGSSGRYSLQLTGPATLTMFGANDVPNTITQTLGAGVRYRFSARVKAPQAIGRARLRVREYDGGVQVGPILYSTPVVLSSSWQTISLETVASRAGSTLDLQVLDEPIVFGERFMVDDISIVVVPASAAPHDAAAAGASPVPEPGLDRVPLQMSVTPHPARAHSVLEFATAERGPLRLALYDLQGRQVRTLIDETEAAAGLHRAPLSREGGARLAAGVYFWKLEAGEGARRGRIVVME